MTIEHVRVADGFHVAIRIVGPVAPDGRQPDWWTALIVDACATGLTVHNADRRPERAVRTARRYLHRPVAP